MQEFRSKIGHLPIKNIPIPGSHDSFTSCLCSHSSVAPGEDRWIDMPIIKSVGIRLAKTHYISMREQLDIGIRYLDLRVAQVRGIFYTHHAYIATNLLNDLALIKDFIDTNLCEVVLLHFSHFKAMDNPKYHNELITTIQQLFDKLIAPDHYTPEHTLEQFITENKRVIVLYEWYNPNKDDQRLWFQDKMRLHFETMWFNKDNTKDLLEKMTAYLNNPPTDKIYITQAIITPPEKSSGGGIVSFLNKFGSLEGAAKAINPLVVQHLRSTWKNKKKKHIYI